MSKSFYGAFASGSEEVQREWAKNRSLLTQNRQNNPPNAYTGTASLHFNPSNTRPTSQLPGHNIGPRKRVNTAPGSQNRGMASRSYSMPKNNFPGLQSCLGVRGGGKHTAERSTTRMRKLLGGGGKGVLCILNATEMDEPDTLLPPPFQKSPLAPPASKLGFIPHSANQLTAHNPTDQYKNRRGSSYIPKEEKENLEYKRPHWEISQNTETKEVKEYNKDIVTDNSTTSTLHINKNEIGSKAKIRFLLRKKQKTGVQASFHRHFHGPKSRPGEHSSCSPRSKDLEIDESIYIYNV